MTAEQKQRIKDVFESVLDSPLAERTHLIGQLCADDAVVRAEVEALLRAHTEADGFLAGSPLRSLAFERSPTPPFDFAGRRIGVYELQREIGQGGMATVYLAERMDGEYRQQVALKLVWPSGDLNEITRRFKRERQILAALDHPNIARLLDGGTTAEGWPYLVMEYIAGVHITHYCRAHNLVLTERLRLFQTVCAAVAYAHRNLVVHRDIKPSNILVTENGAEKLPKLLDFGIAKLLAPDAVGEAQPTITGLRPMTPEYASPEQMREETITTATDVYSLGVLLYELLTGAHPHDLKDRPLHEITRIVCEEDPPPPSVRVPQLRGDLDNITLVALRKEPSQRYQTVEQFSIDITRFLAGETVTARPATLLYRTGKFVRRNKTGVAVTATAILLLLAGLFITLRQNQLQRHQLYAADMRQAGQDWTERNLVRARELVERHQPNSSFLAGDDLRGFEWFYLWNALHPAQLTLQHQGIAGEFAITADHAHVYVGTQSGAIELWNLTTQQFERIFARQPERLRTLALSRDGTRLASGGENGALFVWDVVTGRQLFQNPAPSAVKLYVVTFSHDGNLLVAGGTDGLVSVWDVNTAKLIHSLRYSEKWVQGVAFSPDGALLAVAGTGDKTVKIWDARSFQFLKALTGSGETFFNLAFSPDGKYLAAPNRDNKVLVWSVAEGKLVQTIANYQPDSVWSIDFSPDGKTLATAGPMRTIRLWDWATGRDFASVQVEFESSMICFLPNVTEQILLVTTGTSTKIFNFRQIKLPVSITPHARDVTSVAISPDGQTLAYGEEAGKLTLRNLGTSRSSSLLVAANLPIVCTAFSPDGQTLAIAYGLTLVSGTVELRDPVSGQIRLAPGAFNHYVNHLTFSPDGKTIATANSDGTIIVRDLATLQSSLTIRTEPDDVFRVIYSKDGQRLISLHANHLARGWDAHTGAKLFEFHCLGIGDFSPDGKFFSSADERYNITLHDGLTGVALRTLKGHSGFPFSIVFSPDGKRLASAGDDLNIRLWEVETGTELLALKGHTRRVIALAFSPDGKTLVSGGRDKTLRIWRTATEEEVRGRSKPQPQMPALR